ncbi:ER lumen protein-retaining receptor [Astathelohania contejeani]|uniref:ER lumen protein-retaining receptor n=1 Tax=Astathelohania contejeani TaxID=164912 RepID=A0ABQ7I137_9MICR|nr:ER lumen protein-retaining receptor [Thelohania contejeani]
MNYLYSLAMILRFLGDFSHIYTIVILAQKIKTTRSCSGLSYKTQLLYFLVFITRYLDLFYFNVESLLMLYNTVMKIIFLSSQSMILYLIRVKYHYSYDKSLDTFKNSYVIIPAALLAIIFKEKTYSFLKYIVEYSWTFSVLLESVAILPQLVQLQETGEAETLTSKYIFFLGIYRVLYTLGWLLKKMQGLKVDHLLVATGILQALLYTDFFILYYKHVFATGGAKKSIPKTKTKEIIN